jgi:hypothetical protein
MRGMGMEGCSVVSWKKVSPITFLNFFPEIAEEDAYTVTQCNYI